MLLPFYGKIEELRQKETSAVTVVTELDIKVEQLLETRLKGIDPTIGFVGEETGGDRTRDRFWLVDPIDGTNHFIRGTPFCTSMLALVEEGQVTFGAVYDFLNDIMYTAEKDAGALMNGQAIRVSTRPLARAYMGWESHVDKEKNLKLFLQLRDRCVLFKTVSSGYEYALVASGKLDGRLCFDPHGRDYDYAPGSLLVSEAGGVVANIGRRTYDYRNTDFIAANPIVYRELTEGPSAIFPV